MDVCFQAPPSRVATADLVNFAGFATNATTVNVPQFVDVRCYLAVRKAAKAVERAKSNWVACREVRGERIRDRPESYPAKTPPRRRLRR
jgi:hypothetical protein